MKVTIEEISGQMMTVVWYHEEAKSICSRHKALWPIEWRIDGVGEWFASDGTHIATALPPLPRHPKPEDAPLLYRYMSEGLEPRDKCGNTKMQQDYGNAWFTRHPITHAIDSQTGERVDVAIKDKEQSE